MKKKEMISKLLRYNGIGVRVTTITGFTDYLFYEDFTDEEGNVNDGISRAYKHFSHGETALLYPDDNAIQEKCDQFHEFLVKTLVRYTGFSDRKAKRQILLNAISYNKFKEKVV